MIHLVTHSTPAADPGRSEPPRPSHEDSSTSPSASPAGDVPPYAAHLTVWGQPAAVSVAGVAPEVMAAAVTLLTRLDRLWDPTRPDSDLHRLYTSIGTVTAVETETAALVELAVRLATRRAARPTDPFVGPADGPAPSHPTGVVVDARRGRVGLPAQDALDLTGLAPVLAATLTVHLLVEHGATGVSVRVGDTVRTAGDLTGLPRPEPLQPRVDRRTTPPMARRSA